MTSPTCFITIHKEYSSFITPTMENVLAVFQSSSSSYMNNQQGRVSGVKSDVDVPPSSGENSYRSTEVEAKPGKKKARTPRYAFETRSAVDILDDGYRWRKYGQKSVKNNIHPRSYYRCTHQGCKVKKQVQRLSKDKGIVVTTYDGMHTHATEKTTDNFENILSEMQIYNRC